MIQLRQIVRLVGWFIAGAAALFAGAYLVALLINLSDRPRSEETSVLLDEWQNRPRIPDAQNGYVYVLGFGADVDSDPAVVGQERAWWIRRLRSNLGIGTSPDPHPEKFPPLSMPGGSAPLANCDTATGQRRCFFGLERLGDELEPWLERHAWVLERYSGLLDRPAWDEIVTLDRRGGPDLIWFGPRGPDSPFFQAQGVWLLEAWRRAREGDAATVHDMLARDIGFWRNVLVSAQTQMMKSFAIGMIERHFERANIILARLPAQRVAEAIPAAWHKEISPEERSMRRVFAAQLRIAEMLMQSYYAEVDPYESYAGVEIESQSFWERLSAWTNRAFMQPQDLVNKQARQFLVLGEAVKAPYDELAAELERVRHYDVVAEMSDSWTDSIYNFVLNDVVGPGSLNVHIDVAARTADLEGLRRAALAAAELRSNGVPPDEVGPALVTMEQRNPYTGEPLTWQPDSREIVFQGILRGYRGRHALWY